jgi:hypothetical protein
MQRLPLFPVYLARTSSCIWLSLQALRTILVRTRSYVSEACTVFFGQRPLNYYKLAQEVYTRAGFEAVSGTGRLMRFFVRFENNIKGGPKTVSIEDLLHQGAFMHTDSVSIEKRIYKSCQYSVTAIIAVYIDNNVCYFNCIELLEEFEALLKKDGQIKMLREGMLEWLLGVRLTLTKSQAPLSLSVDLESLPLAERLNEDVLTSYTSLVGELIYIAINLVPQICYVLSAPTRYMTKATEAHFNYAKGVCRYLKGVRERRITWCATDFLVTCEAELMAYCSCACEVVYARKLAAELGLCQMTPTKIYEDNAGALVLVKNMHLRNRSKHIALRFAFAKILYDHGHILPVPCPSEDQHADIGTNAPCSATVQQAFPGTPWRNQAFAVTIMLL